MKRDGLMASFMRGMEFGSMLVVLACLLLSKYDAALANVAIAAYARYARSP